MTSFSNEGPNSLKDSSFPTAYIIYSHISPNSLEVYPRTIVHMLTSVKAAEKRADSLISWGFSYIYTAVDDAISHKQRCAGVIMRRWFMTFPVDILCYYSIMSSYSSLDHGPGFPVHYLPSTQQSIKKGPSSHGFKLSARWILWIGMIAFMTKCQKITKIISGIYYRIHLCHFI